MSEKPEMKVRAGAISATVWSNEAVSKKGDIVSFRTISLQRGYQDKDGNWQSTNNFRVSDLPKASLLLNKVYEAIVLTDQDLPGSVSFDNVPVEEIKG